MSGPPPPPRGKAPATKFAPLVQGPAIGQVTLKPTQRVEKPTALSLAEGLAAEKAGQEAADIINSKVRGADIEQWYDALKDVTYETVFLPITIEEGKAMVEIYDSKDTGASVSPQLNETIRAMTSKLQTVMNKYESGCFIKLSSRSAKDSSISSDRTKNIFRKLINEVPNPTLNDKLIAINRAHILALQLTDAKEVVDMFLGSERINSDLKLALDYSHNWTQDFVIREFVPVPIEFEFRAFVVNNQLRGMCQYYHYMYFPRLVDNKVLIDQLVHKKFEEIKDLVPIPDKTYVIDWAVDLDRQKVYIIELNPFGDYEGMGTSPSMFKLHEHQMDRAGPDRNIFFGDGEYEFRIETEASDVEAMTKLLCPEWKQLFAETFGSTF